MSTYKSITAAELMELKRQSKVEIIDIREQDEYDYEHIPDAESIPLSKLSNNSVDLTKFKGKSLVFLCQSGIRSEQSKRLYENFNADKVFILEEGIKGWKKANGEVISNSKMPLPIMRQVQIFVGFMVLVSALLGLFVSVFFIWIAVFFGIGLLIAGITGTCLLANLLSLLSFNRRI